jgi:hypothetical protein
LWRILFSTVIIHNFEKTLFYSLCPVITVH